MRSVHTLFEENPAKRPEVSQMGVGNNGRWIWVPGKEEGKITGREVFHTNLQAEHFKKGKLYDKYELGSGTVLNAGVNMLSQDPSWVTAATPFCTLSSMNYVSTGTGVTGSAATDFWLQTVGTHFSGSTNNYFTGAITVTGGATPNLWKNVATVNYSGTETVSEWVLCMSNAATVARTSAGTAPTTTTFTDTGATYTTAGNGLKGYSIEINSTLINTPTTTVMGLITSNTGTVLTLAGGWWTLANAAASTPGSTVAYNIIPTAWDHKQFTGIGVNSGDSIQFTYTLTLASGG